MECEQCIKRKTMYCPNSSECYELEDKPQWQNRIMLLEENQSLKDKIEELESEIKHLKEEMKYREQDIEDNYKRISVEEQL